MRRHLLDILQDHANFAEETRWVWAIYEDVVSGRYATAELALYRAKLTSTEAWIEEAHDLAAKLADQPRPDHMGERIEWVKV